MNILKAREEMMFGKTIYDMNLRVADYGRVSTDKDDQLNSLENQVKYFDDFIGNVKNWTHVRSYADEGISGTQVYKREQFLQMIEDARLGKIDLILTKEVSRFARNTVDSIKFTQDLLGYGVAVLFISDNINTINPDSEFRLAIMASMAQDEVRKLSERVKFGIKRSLKDGKIVGGNAYGYTKKDGILYIDEEKAVVVRKLFELYATGEYGFKRIGEILASEGYYTKKGKVFADTTLKKMIKNKKYKGFYTGNMSQVVDYKTHKKVANPESEWIQYKEPEKVPPIVSEELWEKANAILNKRNSHWAKTVLNKEFFLENRTYTSKIFCKEHNTTFIRTASCKYKENPIWQCNEYLRHGIKGCETPRLYEKHLDYIFKNLLSRFIENKEKTLNNILQDYITLIKECNSSSDIEKMKEKVKEQETYKERLLDMSLRKMISDEDFQIKNNKISEEIKSLKTEIVKLEANMENPTYYKNIVKDIKDYLTTKIDLDNNLHKYFNIFVDKVFVSKVNNNRKHIKLEVLFNFKSPNDIIELNYEDKDKPTFPKSEDTTFDIGNVSLPLKNNRNYNINLSFDNDFLRQKFLLTARKESWSLYENTYKFIENPLNGKKSTQILEVHTTSDFTYNGEIYNIAQDFITPKKCLSFVSNHVKGNRRINNKLYDINTNSYKNLITNKDAEIVQFYNEIEDYVLRKDSKIIRNYLKKGVTFKFNKRIMEVMIKEKELLITFLKDVKPYDTENRLFIRKGYENCALCYAIYVNNAESVNYALKLFNSLYEVIIDPYKDNYVNNLLKEISNNIKEIDRSIKAKKLNKGIMFCANRNFTMIEKRKYGLHIRLLPVEDKDNILGVVGRSTLEPLCRFFKVREEKDIELVMPLIKESFYKTKYPAYDIKNGLNKFYIGKDANYVK